MLKRNSFAGCLIVYDFSRYIVYIIYSSFINSRNKNNSVEVEFYRKKIINQHFFSQKSRKIIRNVCLRLETCEENMRKKIE